VRTVARDPRAETREFLLGLGVAFGTMIVVALVTLYLLGAFASRQTSVDLPAAGPRVYTSDDLTPQAKPTAVWKFRAEWQKPTEP
jgi:hypothetical protein